MKIFIYNSKNEVEVDVKNEVEVGLAVIAFSEFYDCSVLDCNVIVEPDCVGYAKIPADIAEMKNDL